ncbi:MAG: uL15 family ribosomal protein [Candidatus Daviesbacteria bacterium]|nr:uL15 family ribosomal protein [Candidatus Daviesbacteria bacterium]
MSFKKTKKRKKSSRYHGRNMGTCGKGARKKAKGSGHRGGKGMAGTGKRGDQKKSLVLKLYGHGYFGKQGITSKGTERDKRDRINVGEIQEKYKPGELNLSSYKILGDGEIKNKFIITAQSASKSAIEKVEKAGGKIIVEEIKEMKTPLVEYNRKKEKPKVEDKKKEEGEVKKEKGKEKVEEKGKKEEKIVEKE